MKFIPVNRPIIGPEEKKNILECFKNNEITNGRYIKKFENQFAKFHKKKFGITVSNGTAALEIAIKSLSLRKNSEVIIPTFSIISSALCVIKNDLKPVFVDCSIDTWNCRAEDIISKITKNTSAIILTHIYGLPVDMDKILKFAKKRKIKIIEDAAEAIGLKYKNNYCGSYGDVSTFSFYANKHITTGEGGMIITSNREVFEKCKSLKNLCFSNSPYDRFIHKDVGWNYRLTNIQSSIGYGQFKRIKKIINTKYNIGNYYYNALKNLKNIILQRNQTKYSKNIYWVFGIVLKNKLSNKRNLIMKKLLDLGIETRTFFYPLHRQKVLYRYKNSKKVNFPNSNYISKNGFYIPSGLGTTKYEMQFIVKNLKKILS